ncbi:SDR family oxidoreductase [Dyella sp. M7H15-1]|uniref:SDR family NAD(P)-dependent oxidoreductase n=1 Tax=Dyella sp. M7H15-1 TaxID=2501295 RepID=UPI001005163D|nr:SDR family oxidoreductase [Dyella sp. M7H15-1]QAU25129.1 SDR family oxidoreductase [Dyella sp. M7H15-1]
MYEPPAPTVPPASAVLVTGGSRGLGLAVVRELLQNGVRVATFARTMSEELQQLQQEFGEWLFAACVDANHMHAVNRFMLDASERLGSLDGLICNAAVGQDSLLCHTSTETIAALIGSNLTHPLCLIRSFARKLLHARRPGRIVTITSIAARRTYPGLAVYAATKAGMEAATLVLAHEARGRILVNCVAPGFFESDMSAPLGSAQRASIARRTVTGRLMKPQHVVPVIRMLMLDAIDMNGQVIVVDGGARA